jgi:hypothetical protein
MEFYDIISIGENNMKCKNCPKLCPPSYRKNNPCDKKKKIESENKVIGKDGDIWIERCQIEEKKI